MMPGDLAAPPPFLNVVSKPTVHEAGAVDLSRGRKVFQTAAAVSRDETEPATRSIDPEATPKTALPELCGGGEAEHEDRDRDAQLFHPPRFHGIDYWSRVKIIRSTASAIAL